MHVNPDLIRDVTAGTYPADTTVIRVHPDTLREHAFELGAAFAFPEWRMQARMVDIFWGSYLVVRDSNLVLGDFAICRDEHILWRGPLMVA